MSSRTSSSNFRDKSPRQNYNQKNVDVDGANNCQNPPPPNDSLPALCLCCYRRYPMTEFFDHLRRHIARDRDFPSCNECFHFVHIDPTAHEKCFEREAKRFLDRSHSNCEVCSICKFCSVDASQAGRHFGWCHRTIACKTCGKLEIGFLGIKKHACPMTPPPRRNPTAPRSSCYDSASKSSYANFPQQHQRSRSESTSFPRPPNQDNLPRSNHSRFRDQDEGSSTSAPPPAPLPPQLPILPKPTDPFECPNSPEQQPNAKEFEVTVFGNVKKESDSSTKKIETSAKNEKISEANRASKDEAKKEKSSTADAAPKRPLENTTPIAEKRPRMEIPKKNSTASSSESSSTDSDDDEEDVRNFQKRLLIASKSMANSTASTSSKKNRPSSSSSSSTSDDDDEQNSTKPKPATGFKLTDPRPKKRNSINLATPKVIYAPVVASNFESTSSKSQRLEVEFYCDFCVNQTYLTRKPLLTHLIVKHKMSHDKSEGYCYSRPRRPQQSPVVKESRTSSNTFLEKRPKMRSVGFGDNVASSCSQCALRKTILEKKKKIFERFIKKTAVGLEKMKDQLKSEDDQ